MEKEEIKKVIQCCFCKANSERFNIKFFNLEEREHIIIANGCQNCKNYAESFNYH